jgi:hypothetical protein
VVEEVEEEPEGLKKESRRFCCIAPRDAWKEEGREGGREGRRGERDAAAMRLLDWPKKPRFPSLLPPSLPPSLPTLSLAMPDLTRSGLKPRLSIRNSSSPASLGS